MSSLSRWPYDAYNYCALTGRSIRQLAEEVFARAHQVNEDEMPLEGALWQDEDLDLETGDAVEGRLRIDRLPETEPALTDDVHEVTLREPREREDIPPEPILHDPDRE